MVREFRFEFKGMCDIHALFIERFRNCFQKGCFHNFKHVPAEPRDGNKIVLLEMSSNPVNHHPLRFLFEVAENMANSPGLIISETKSTRVDHTGPVQYRRTYKQIVVAEDVVVCVEEFMSYFHINFFKHICRRKYKSKVLAYPADAEETVATHFEAFKLATEHTSAAIEEVKKQYAQLAKDHEELSQAHTHLMRAHNTLASEVSQLTRSLSATVKEAVTAEATEVKRAAAQPVKPEKKQRIAE